MSEEERKVLATVTPEEREAINALGRRYGLSKQMGLMAAEIWKETEPKITEWWSEIASKYGLCVRDKMTVNNYTGEITFVGDDDTDGEA